MENNNEMKQEKQNQNMENNDVVGPSWPHFVENEKLLFVKLLPKEVLKSLLRGYIA